MSNIDSEIWRQEQIEPCHVVHGVDSKNVSTYADLAEKGNKAHLEPCKHFNKCASREFACSRYVGYFNGFKREAFMGLSLRMSRKKFKKTNMSATESAEKLCAVS